MIILQIYLTIFIINVALILINHTVFTNSKFNYYLLSLIMFFNIIVTIMIINRIITKEYSSLTFKLYSMRYLNELKECSNSNCRLAFRKYQMKTSIGYREFERSCPYCGHDYPYNAELDPELKGSVIPFAKRLNLFTYFVELIKFKRKEINLILENKNKISPSTVKYTKNQIDLYNKMKNRE